MSELKSENDINNKNVKASSHTVSKSLSKTKWFFINSFLNLANFDINCNPFQLNSDNIFAFPVSKYIYLYILILLFWIIIGRCPIFWWNAKWRKFKF